MTTPARPSQSDITLPEAPAMLSRPRITTTVRIKITATRYIEREITRFADVLLIDKMHHRGQLSDRQHTAACRLYGLWIAGGGPGRTTARYDVAPEQAEEYEEAVEGDEQDGDARDAFNALLRDAGAVWAELLAGLCADEHPGAWRLVGAQDALDWLADGWGMEK